MGYVRFLLSIAALAVLSACAGPNNLGSHNPRPPASIRTTLTLAATLLQAGSCPKKLRRPWSARSRTRLLRFPADKLIALTFDDGPRPYVLFGSKASHPAPGLVDILDQNGVKATFFVVGWRLTPKTWGEPRHEEDIGVTCLDAAGQTDPARPRTGRPHVQPSGIAQRRKEKRRAVGHA